MELACACGRVLEYEPTEVSVRLTALPDAPEIKGVMIARCRCGLVRMHLPELPPEQKAALQALVAEGKSTGLSMGYSTPKDVDDGRTASNSPAGRARVGRRVPPAFRPRRKR